MVLPLLLMKRKKKASSPSLLTNLTAYYTLNEASGNRVDSTGDANNVMAPTGAVGSAAGVVGNGATFGTGKTLRNAGTADLRIPTTGDFTVAFWLKTGASVTTCYLVCNDQAAAEGHSLLVLTNRLYWRFSAGAFAADATAAGTLATNTTYFVVARIHRMTGENLYSVMLNSGEYRIIKTNTLVPGSTNQTWLGGYTTLEMPSDWVLDEVGFWNRWLSDTEVTALNAGVTYPFTGLSTANPYYSTYFYINGDSLTASPGTGGQTAWADQVSWGSAPQYVKSNVAASGRTMAQIDTALDLPTLATIFKPSYLKNVAVIWAGTNDIASGSSAATTYTKFVSVCDKFKAMGSKIIVLNCLPRAVWTPSGSDAIRNTYNASIAGDPTKYDYLVDVAAISQLQDPNNATYYIDGTHLTTAGYALVAAAMQTAIAAV